MSRDVLVDVATVKQDFPAGTVPAGIQITISGLPGKMATTAPYSAVFAGVPDGDYTATAQAVDATGAALGSPQSVPFSVVTPATVSVDVPQSVTVTMN